MCSSDLNGTFWNPKDSGTGNSFSNNNMKVSGSGSSPYTVRTNTSKSTGKFYVEYTCNAIDNSNGGTFLGVATSAAGLNNSYVGQDAYGWGWYSQSGTKFNSATSTAYGSSYNTGDVLGIALNMTDGKVYFSKNGVWQNSGTPGGAETGFAFSGLSGSIFVAVALNTVGGAQQGTLNTGASNFAYTPPSGYTAWDTTVYSPGVY